MNATDEKKILTHHSLAATRIRNFPPTEAIEVLSVKQRLQIVSGQGCGMRIQRSSR
jgi:hypothetical protein